MMKNSSFVAIIMTHGRPDRVHTARALKRQGYTGRVIILIDNEDQSRVEYEKKFGSQVHVFDKKRISDTFDEGDNFEDRRAIELDDDYQDFRYRADGKLQFCDKTNISNLDGVFDAMVNFLKVSNATTIAMAQNGDFIGGKNGSMAKKLKLRRKAMNTFVFNTDCDFRIFGRINEDVNSYTCAGRRGVLFLTVPNIGICQKQTQSSEGGMTELYLESGTYVKSFYSVMYAPSCVKVSDMGPVFRRMHHRVNWKNAVPCILGQEHKKN